MSVDISALTEVKASSVNLITPGHKLDTANAIRYVTHAYPDEPLFVIRGRDALAVPAIEAYMEECARHGLSAMRSQVLAHRGRFITWQHGHTPLTKLPDVYLGWINQETQETIV